MRRLVALAGLAALLAGPACTGGDDDDGFRLTLDGEAEIADEPVDAGDHTVDAGATIRVTAGVATLELPGDREVLLREGSSLVAGSSPELLDGDAVVVVADPTQLDAGPVEITVAAGAARVQRGVGTTVAMYGGTAEVTSAGRSLAGGLRALRQVTVPGEGQLPREPSPLVYAADDRWDATFLGDAIALGRDLDGLSRGFTAQLGPGASVDAALLSAVLPIEIDDSIEIDPDRSPGETVVGAAIVVEADDDVAESWSEVFGFRGDGAEWGLVALDQEVERDPLLGTLDGAFDASPLLFAATPSPRPRDRGGVRSTPTTATPTTPPAPDPTSPPPTEPPEEDEPEPPTTLPPIGEDGEPGNLIEGVVDLIGDLLRSVPLGELLGG